MGRAVWEQRVSYRRRVRGIGSAVRILLEYLSSSTLPLVGQLWLRPGTSHAVSAYRGGDEGCGWPEFSSTWPHTYPQLLGGLRQPGIPP